MAKKPTVTTLQSGFNSTETLNTNFEALRDGFDNTLSLDGSTPNAMEADLDLNGNNIIGAAGLLINGTDYLSDVEAAKAAALVAQAAAELAETNAETAETNAEASETAAGLSATAAATSETNAGASETAASASATASATSATNSATSASEAAASASAASTSETNAATSETNAATSETNAATSATESETAKTAAEAAKDAALAALDSFDDRYLGAKASDPTLDNDGNVLVAGALYYNTTDDVMKVYEGSVWVAAYASLSGALIATNNLSDVLDVAASRTNLGLGTAATTASTDYATAAQGTLADSAVQPNDSPTFAGLTVDTDTLYVDATGNKVGIGTSLPSELLHLAADAPRIWVDASSTGESTFNGDSLNGGVVLTAQDMNASSKYTPALMFGSTDSDLTTNNPRIGAAIVAEAAQTFSADTTGAMHLSFWTREGTLTTAQNAEERMRISSSGNVGIGTTSPDARLMVSEGVNDTASAMFYNTAGGSGSVKGKGYIGFGISEGWNFHGAEIGWDQEALSGYRQALTFSTRENSDVRPTERMRIDSSGNVGIGTTNPSTALDVTGTVTATSFAGDGSALTGIAAGATGGGNDDIFYENGQNVTTNYTITNGKNAMSAGPITIDSGVTVTVGAGETWTVV